MPALPNYNNESPNRETGTTQNQTPLNTFEAKRIPSHSLRPNRNQRNPRRRPPNCFVPPLFWTLGPLCDALVSQ